LINFDSDTSSLTVSASKRWTPSSISGRRNVNSIYNQSIGSSSMTHIRNSYEAEDISTYDRARTIGNSTGSLCGIGGASSSSVPTGSSRYYSPPGTSYTIVERSHSPHFYYNSAGDGQTAGSSKSRGLYLDTLKQNGHKRPISPDRMFPTTSSSTPSSYHHMHTNGRNSPPVSSSSHQIYHRSGRDRSMVTRTVTMVRDTQPDGTHGFGICVKGGRETGSLKTKKLS
jgi:whirlin